VGDKKGNRGKKGGVWKLGTKRIVFCCVTLVGWRGQGGTAGKDVERRKWREWAGSGEVTEVGRGGGWRGGVSQVGWGVGGQDKKMAKGVEGKWRVGIWS